MAGSLPHDLRSRVLAAVDGGLSRRSAADRFGVGIATAIRWVRAWRDEGRPTPLPMGGDVRSHRIEAFRDVILEAIETQKDITLAELADMLRRDHRASFADSTVWRFLDRHDVTFKKTAHASEQERPDVLARRQAWFAGQPDLDPERLVFIDETGASTKMARLRGRARRGQRCRASVPHGHWKTTTFVGALRLGRLGRPTPPPGSSRTCGGGPRPHCGVCALRVPTHERAVLHGKHLLRGGGCASLLLRQSGEHFVLAG